MCRLTLISLLSFNHFSIAVLQVRNPQIKKKKKIHVSLLFKTVQEAAF